MILNRFLFFCCVLAFFLSVLSICVQEWKAAKFLPQAQSLLSLLGHGDFSLIKDLVLPFELKDTVALKHKKLAILEQERQQAQLQAAEQAMDSTSDASSSNPNPEQQQQQQQVHTNVVVPVLAPEMMQDDPGYDSEEGGYGYDGFY
jgi:hypothetical protein